jgi:hypothetical protein
MPQGLEAHEDGHAANGEAEEEAGCIETGFGNCHLESHEYLKRDAAPRDFRTRQAPHQGLTFSG